MFNTTEKASLTLAYQLPLSLYTLFSTLLGLLGNLTLLITSLKYNSLKLDHTSLTLVQHLSAADLLYTLLCAAPSFVVYSTKTQLPTLYCEIQPNISLYLGAATINLVFIISLYRLMSTCVFPHGMAIATKRNSNILPFIIWAYSFIPPLTSILSSGKAYFSFLHGRCLSRITLQPYVIAIYITLFTILPVLSIIIINSLLLKYALTHSSSAKKTVKAVRTVCGISFIFLISYLPYITNMILNSLNRPVHSLLKILCFNTIFINTFSNPIIYAITNQRFGYFINSMARRGVFVASCGRFGVLKKGAYGASMRTGVSKKGHSVASLGNAAIVQKQLKRKTTI